MIFLPSPATATAEKRAEARARAESVLAEPRGAEAFAQVVARHSADQATRYRGGELPWLSRGSQEVDAAVADALFAIAAEGIRYELSRRNAEQAERDFFATMKRGLDIQIRREAVEALTLPAEKESAPPSMPGAVGAR